MDAWRVKKLNALVAGIERISRRAYCADEIGKAGQIYGLAQPTDMNVDRPEFDIAVHAPHCVEKSFAGKDSPGMFKKMTEQPELGRAQLKQAPCPPHLVGNRIHFKIGIRQRLASQGGANAPQDRCYTGNQLSR